MKNRLSTPGLYCFLLAASFACQVSQGDQPIFNEMPRWSDGWGVQAVHEYRTETDLLLGTRTVGSGLDEHVSIMHLEGVYTWDKSIRLTAKLPYVIEAERELLRADGSKYKERDEGVGDLTLALPLKRYFNLDGRSGSWTFAPQVRIPLDKGDGYEVYDHEWGVGLSTGYETETEKYLFGIGTTAWYFFDHEPYEVSANLDLGRNIQWLGSSGHLKWETDALYEDDHSFTVTIGPALYWRISDLVHTYFSWKHDVYDKQGSLDHGNGNTFKAGIAFVF